MTSQARLTLMPKTLDVADSRAKAVLEKANAQVGFIPNIYAEMDNSPGPLQTYLEGSVFIFGARRLRAVWRVDPQSQLPEMRWTAEQARQ
jgi:hypothetical protein